MALVYRQASWIARLHAAEDVAGLKTALAEAVAKIGSRYFIFSAYYSMRGIGREKFVLTNCPRDWVKRWTGATVGASPLDYALHGVTPVPWAELVRHDPPWFANAQAYGLEAGVTYPIHDGNKGASLLSLVYSANSDAVRQLLAKGRSMGHVIAPMAHTTFFRILRRQLGSFTTGPDLEGRKQSASLGNLTDRERECLVRAATGDTGRQIAAVLQISEQTVIWHLRNVRKKLGASTSRQAFVRAMSEGWLSPPGNTETVPKLSRG